MSDYKKYVVNKRVTNKYDIYVGRPTKWGNPFTHLKSDNLAKYKVDTVEEAVAKYKDWFLQQKFLINCLPDLKGKILACWCAPNPCHAYILAELANTNL